MESNTLYLKRSVSIDDPYPLVEYIATHPGKTIQQWQGWSITPINGGWNNLLYRATKDRQDWAIKFTIRDDRRRARREFMALQALYQMGITNVPQPILLNEDSFQQPAVVQSWLPGDVATVPHLPGDWQGLLNHYAEIHTVTPEKSHVELPEAVITAHSAQQVIDNVQLEAARIPPEAHHPLLAEMLEQLETCHRPDWAVPPVTLCRTDPNITNFIRSDSEWYSVDWENAGWGDPAWEIADLLAHPAYMPLSPADHLTVINTYYQLANDPEAVVRIRFYYKCILVWWVARLARYPYDAAHNLDPRLAEQSDEQKAKQKEKLEFYVQQARDEIL